MKFLLVFLFADFIFALLLASHRRIKQVKKITLDDLANMSEEQRKAALPERVCWLLYMNDRLSLVAEKVKELSDFYKQEKILNRLNDNDKVNAYGLVSILGQRLSDMSKNMIGLCRNPFKLYVLCKLYDHNQRVLKVCDPRPMYNIISVLDKGKQVLEKSPDATDIFNQQFMFDNLQYKELASPF